MRARALAGGRTVTARCVSDLKLAVVDDAYITWLAPSFYLGPLLMLVLCAVFLGQGRSPVVPVMVTFGSLFAVHPTIMLLWNSSIGAFRILHNRWYPNPNRSHPPLSRRWRCLYALFGFRAVQIKWPAYVVLWVWVVLSWLLIACMIVWPVVAFWSFVVIFTAAALAVPVSTVICINMIRTTEYAGWPVKVKIIAKLAALGSFLVSLGIAAACGLLLAAVLGVKARTDIAVDILLAAAVILSAGWGIPWLWVGGTLSTIDAHCLVSTLALSCTLTLLLLKLSWAVVLTPLIVAATLFLIWASRKAWSERAGPDQIWCDNRHCKPRMHAAVAGTSSRTETRCEGPVCRHQAR